MSRFLIVIKNEAIYRIYKQMLELKEHEVIGPIINIDECFEKSIKKLKDPDFILIDDNISEENGLPTIKKLLKSKPNLRIILVGEDETIKEDLIESGAAGFIKKPFTLHTFYQSLEEIRS